MEIKDIERIQLNPNDIVLITVSVDDMPKVQQIEFMKMTKDTMEKVLEAEGHKNKILVVTDRITVSKIPDEHIET